MSPPLVIARCTSARDWRRFETLPERLHGADPAYVPPFPGDVMKLRKPEHPFHLDGHLTAYVATRAGRPVGRIAAVHNRTHNRFHGDRTGFFGFFDFADAEVAAALLARVREELRAAGFDRMRGPYSPTQNDECGLQVEGFGEAPYFGMPYNPPSYVGVYEGLGLAGVRDLLAYGIEQTGASEGGFFGRMDALVARIKQRYAVTVRAVDIARLEEECARVVRVFNEGLAGEWGFMPLSVPTALSFAKDLLEQLEPEAILIAESGGEPVGISIALPNLNEFLADAKRLPRWLRWPRLAWLIKTSRPKRARWAVFAMTPEWRKRGGTLLLIHEAVTRFMPRYPGGEMSWTQEGNDDVNRLAAQFDLAPTKRYRIYEAPL